MLAIMTEPGLLITLVPVGIVVLGLVTFELAMAVTISTLPRSRFQQKWTPQEHRRVLRVFGVIFSAWPITAILIVAHVYMPFWLAVIGDAVALAILVLCVRWLIQGMRERRLVMAGHCMKCFYDLRANKESEQCPECGVGLEDHPARAKPPPRGIPAP